MPLMTDALMADCASMTHERFGQYMRLLVMWWRDGCRPASEDYLCELCGLDANAFDRLKRFLTETPEGWTQKKLFAVYAKQMARKSKARDSANMRWECERNANASPEHMRTSCDDDAIHNPTTVSPNGDTLAPEKSSQTVSREKPAKREKTRASRDELVAVFKTILSDEAAEALYAHRRECKAAQTVYAANLLVKQLQRCRDGPQAALEAMIVHNWKGFEPEWYDNAKFGQGRARKADSAGITGTVERLRRSGPPDDGSSGREPVSGRSAEPQGSGDGVGRSADVVALAAVGQTCR